MRKLVVAMAATVLVAGLGASPALPAENALDKKLPEFEGLQRYGCEVRGPMTQFDHSRPDLKTRLVWRVTFWAEHKSPYEEKVKRDWKLLYSYREKRRKGLDDCDAFLDRVRKAHEARYLASR